MWNDGVFLLWNHFADIFYEDQEYGLHILPKLNICPYYEIECIEHFTVTLFSIVNVTLDAQVLSFTVSKVFLKYGQLEAVGTGKCCALMDMFFNIMNISDANSYKCDLKPPLVLFLKVDNP